MPDAVQHRQQWDGNFRVKAAATRRVPRVRRHLANQGVTADVTVETDTDQLGTVYRVIATWSDPEAVTP
jgi:hypothetical protein